jgi:hypothetical protein
MKIEDLQKVWTSLEELSPNVADFSWGPSYEYVLKRQVEALKIVKCAIVKAEGKEAEFEKMKDEIEEFIAAHEKSSRHHLEDYVIMEYFDHYKPKQVKKAIKELR